MKSKLEDMYVIVKRRIIKDLFVRASLITVCLYLVSMMDYVKMEFAIVMELVTKEILVNLRY